MLWRGDGEAVGGVVMGSKRNKEGKMRRMVTGSDDEGDSEMINREERVRRRKKKMP